MSTAPAKLPPLLQPLDAVAILAEAHEAAFHEDAAKAQHLLTTLRLTHSGEAELLARMTALCVGLEAEHRTDLAEHLEGRLRMQDLRPWPLRPPLLWDLLQLALHAALRLERSRHPGPWFVAMALCHGPAWLASAAQLAGREAHRMRRPGGWRLPLPVVDGEAIVAELRNNEPGPGEPAGEVLRLTWRSTAHLIAQSRPGRWSELDPHTEPTR